jgi:hypothetical protein
VAQVCRRSWKLDVGQARPLQQRLEAPVHDVLASTGPPFVVVNTLRYLQILMLLFVHAILPPSIAVVRMLRCPAPA